MMTSHFVLQLNKLISIKIDSFGAIETLYPCDEVIVTLCRESNEYNLAEDCVRVELESLQGLLSSALRNNAPLHESIKQDIGYLWNEELQNKPGLTYESLDSGTAYWVGLRNLLWETRGNAKLVLSSWLYNDSDGSIVLEITPSYPWHFKTSSRKEKFITYEQWLQKYKPLEKFIIPKNVASAWKDQITSVLESIEKNVAALKNQ